MTTFFKLEYGYFRSRIPPSVHFVFWVKNPQKWISDFEPIFGKFVMGEYMKFKNIPKIHVKIFDISF